MLEFAKRVSKLGVPLDMRILDSMPHGFLNLILTGPEFEQANNVCMDMVRNLCYNDLMTNHCFFELKKPCLSTPTHLSPSSSTSSSVSYLSLMSDLE